MLHSRWCSSPKSWLGLLTPTSQFFPAQVPQRELQSEDIIFLAARKLRTRFLEWGFNLFYMKNCARFTTNAFQIQFYSDLALIRLKCVVSTLENDLKMVQFLLQMDGLGRCLSWRASAQPEAYEHFSSQRKNRISKCTALEGRQRSCS